MTQPFQHLTELEAAQIELSMAFAAMKLYSTKYNKARWAHLLGRVATLRVQAERDAKIYKINNYKK
jgi:hypothetical protein